MRHDLGSFRACFDLDLVILLYSFSDLNLGVCNRRRSVLFLNDSDLAWVLSCLDETGKGSLLRKLNKESLNICNVFLLGPSCFVIIPNLILNIE